MYDRTRHLDLTTGLENMALVKNTLRETNQIPDIWRVSIQLETHSNISWQHRPNYNLKR